jgi:hypothetical protein
MTEKSGSGERILRGLLEDIRRAESPPAHHILHASIGGGAMAGTLRKEYVAAFLPRLLVQAGLLEEGPEPPAGERFERVKELIGEYKLLDVNMFGTEALERWDRRRFFETMTAVVLGRDPDAHPLVWRNDVHPDFMMMSWILKGPPALTRRAIHKVVRVLFREGAPKGPETYHA